MKRLFEECDLCAKYNLSNCPYVDEQRQGKIQTNRITPFVPDRRSFLVFPRTDIEVDFTPKESFEEYIKLAKEAIHYQADFSYYADNGCIVRGVARNVENHNLIITYLGCALESLIKQPRVSPHKSQIIYDALDKMITRFSIEKTSKQMFSVFSLVSFAGNNPFTPLYKTFLNTLVRWIEYSHLQAINDKKTAQNWFIFTPLLVRLSTLFSEEIHKIPDLSATVQREKVEVKPLSDSNIKISCIENAYVTPFISQEKTTLKTVSKLIEICKDTTYTENGVTLDFLNSLATSHCLLDRVLSEPFEVSDKTYVLANAFKSIEELIPCCFILINQVSNSSLPIQVSCIDGRDKSEFHLSKYAEWIEKATLGNLNYTVRSISRLVNISADVYYAIQQWTQVKRNGFFHKHGLVYQSWMDMLAGNDENNIPSIENILNDTMELSLQIVLWTHEVCEKIITSNFGS